MPLEVFMPCEALLTHIAGEWLGTEGGVRGSMGHGASGVELGSGELMPSCRRRSSTTTGFWRR